MIRQRLAKLTSNILNPFLVCFIVVVLLTIDATSTVADAVKWSIVSIVFTVLPVFIVVLYLVRIKKLDSIFINPRERRNKIYLLAIGCAITGCIVLILLEAPRLLVTAFVAGLVAIVIFTVINLWWKISLHTAFIAASVTVLIILHGGMVFWTLILIPLVAWARLEMKLHSPAQVASGALLAAVIVLVVFQLFGMISW